MPYANLKDVKLYYQVYGSELSFCGDKVIKKPTLIVLHGGPGLDHTYEIPFLSNCSNFSQVIFLDHRGHGLSHDDNSNNWNLKIWANDVYLFCEAIGINDPFIIGDSFGGHVAIQYSILYPNHSSGIILVDTEAIFNLEEILDNYEKKGGLFIRSIAKKCFENPTEENMLSYMKNCIPLCSENPLPDTFFKYCKVNPEVTRHYNRGELLTVNFLSDLKNVSSPILYLTSINNPVHCLNSAKQTVSELTSPVEFHVFDNCGIVSIDAVDKALVLIKNFILKYTKNAGII